MAKLKRSVITAAKKPRKSVRQLSFAEYRAQIKLPYKPEHISEEQIKKALLEAVV